MPRYKIKMTSATKAPSMRAAISSEGDGKRRGVGGYSTRWGVTPADILHCEVLSICGDTELQLLMNNSQRAQRSDRYAKRGPCTSAVYQKRVGAIHRRIDQEARIPRSLKILFPQY